MKAQTNMQPAPRAHQRGITLVEAVVSLVIVASAIIPAMTALGGASENVLKTKNRRIMRYLAQLVIADIELGKLHPEEEGERYEEGSSGTFEGFGSEDDPDEYAQYEYTVEVLREIPIVGASEEQLEDQGFESTESGQFLGRPVSNDFLGSEEGEEEQPEGQMKRLVIIAIKLVGEDAVDDRTLRVMTYLPIPDEEEQGLDPAGAAGPGGEPSGSGSGAAGSNDSSSGAAVERRD